MSRSVKDLRELICVSRLIVRESDDEREILSDEEQQIIRAFSQMSTHGADYRPESVIYARPTSIDTKSPDSGIGINGQSPDAGDAACINHDSQSPQSPHPPGSRKRSGASRRKKKARQQTKILDTLPAMHELPTATPLPPVSVNPLKVTARPSESSSDEDVSAFSNSSDKECMSLLAKRGVGVVPLSERRSNFDNLLDHINNTMIAEWLNYCNEQVGELSHWIHTGDNFIDFAHFWLSDFPEIQRTEIFLLEYSIILDHLNLMFAEGIHSGKLQEKEIVLFLQALFWEYPNKMLSVKGPHMFLDYLDVLTCERQSEYKVILSNVKCSTSIKSFAQSVLAIRAFSLVSVWIAITNFYRQVLISPRKAAPVLQTTLGKPDPNMDRIYHAIRLGYVDVVHYLLASGKVNSRGVDSNGRTLIFTAVMHNQPKVVHFLLKKVTPRPDCNLVADTGNSPLHAAANNGDVALVTTLLRIKYVQVNTINKLCENATPLHLAVMHGHLHVVEVLLVAGADRNAMMGELSASDIAQDFGHNEILKMLQMDIKDLMA